MVGRESSKKKFYGGIYLTLSTPSCILQYKCYVGNFETRLNASHTCEGLSVATVASSGYEYAL